MTVVKEIGKVEEISLDGDVKLVVHTCGDPYQEAQAASILLSYGWTQTQVSKVLNLSQTNISKRLRLLELEGGNIDRLRQGSLKITPAYYMTRDRLRKK